MQKCRSRHWNSARPQLRGADTGRGLEEEESGDDDDDSDDGGGDDSSSSSSSSATGGQSSSSSPSGQSAKQTCKQCMMMFINQGTYRGLHRTPRRWPHTAWTWRTASVRPRHTWSGYKHTSYFILQSCHRPTCEAPPRSSPRLSCLRSHSGHHTPRSSDHCQSLQCKYFQYSNIHTWVHRPFEHRNFPSSAGQDTVLHRITSLSIIIVIIAF